MGSIKGLNKWNQQGIKDISFQQNNFYYFTRKMAVCASCMEPYFSHIFIKVYQTQRELEENWKEVMYYIALKYQSKLEKMIEKSNFYFCIFVSEKMDVKTRNEIESDSFCAKKYVFEENTSTLEDNLQEIENKIFHINSLGCTKPSPKLESMVLQNFRGYAGNVTVDFRDCRKEAASFVVIYAKNGIGKTSLFDGIEFALKGEIGRIIDLVLKDKKYKSEGAIYHNRENSDKEAFVSLRLDGGLHREIERYVSKVIAGENDIRANAPRKGIEITGTKDVKEKWNQVVLPHDKIDGFISARSATGRYKEWVGSAEPLKQERENFENANIIYKVVQKKGKDLDEEHTGIRTKLEELSESQVSVATLFELIDRYNMLVEPELKLIFQEQADVGQYDKLINQAKKYSRIWGTDILQLEKNIALAREVLDGGLDGYLMIINSIDELNKSVQTLETCIQRKRELDVLVQSDSENKTAITKYQKELGFLQSIVSYGADRVGKECKEYRNIEKQLEDLGISLNYFEMELKKITEENKDAERKKGTVLRLEEGEYKAAEKIVKKLEENNQKQKELQQQYNAAEKANEQHQESIDKRHMILEEILAFQLPKHIKELKLKDIKGIRYVLDNERRKQLSEFEERYKAASMQMQLCQEEILKQEKVAEEIEEICKKGREYLNMHRNVSKCPLCQTSFDSWEDLIFRINHVQTESDGTLKKGMEEIHSELEKISSMYEDFYSKCVSLKEEKISGILKAINDLEEAQQRCIDTIEMFGERRVNLLNQQNQLELWFVQKGIQLKESTFQGLEVWKKEQEEKYLQLENTCKRTMEIKESTQKLVDSTRLVMNEFQEKKNKIVRNPETYSYIEFWMKQPDDFNFYALLQEKKGVLKDHMEKKKDFQEKRAAYRDVENLDLTAAVEQKNQQLKEIEKSKKIKERYGIFEDFSKEGVENCFNNWVEQKEQLGIRKEILEQISEEQGARHYFENYRTYCQELEENKKARLIQKEKEEQAREAFEDKKKVLETGLKEYFDQSIMNEIFQKIDPHDFMKNVEYELSFNDKNEPQLCIHVREDKDEHTDSYRPEWYFSTAQLNTVAFSSFFSRALIAKDLGFRTIFIDDPIGHFDDMNVLGFADLIRSILESGDCQIIMSTHDEKIFEILERKLSDEYYSSCFIRLPESKAVTWKKTD
ncbi:MAG: hypothetical protein HFH44_07020 [Lachnospiraceae bacterium]|nr:hypothetical protein [Lachnospiraceae bacterium]